MTDLHPRLAAAFVALDAAGVRWCLLRGRDDLSSPASDVDLLFHPADAARARRAMTAAEVPALRVWAGGSQNSFLGWDLATERWVNVHAMTEIAFGPFYGLRMRGIDSVFSRLERVRDVPMPAAADGFWITFLHTILDKGSIHEKRRHPLTELARVAGDGGDLAREVDRLAPEPWTAEKIRAAVLAERWDDLESLGPALRARWERLDPSATIRAAAHRVSLFVTKVAEMVTRRGLAVALLAPDGAGKSTLADALPDALFFRARRFYLGLEGGRFAGSGPSSVRGLGIVRRLGYLWRTWLEARYHQARRRFVIFDRYPYEALLAAPRAASPLSVARRRVLGHALPAPDVVLVLDAPGTVLHLRNGEHSAERLERDRLEYLALATRLPRIAVVLDATRPLPEVRRDAVDAMWRAYRRRIVRP